MKSNRSVLITMFAISVGIHLFLSAVWSASRIYGAQNRADESTRTFTVIETLPAPVARESAPARMNNTNVSTPPKTSDKLKSRELSAPELTQKTPPPDKFSEDTYTAGNERTGLEHLRVGPFQSEIDPKKAWINVAESNNYQLLTI